ncbi:hypothetical protein RBB50_012040 [Rhinocladiella similis]
MSSPAWSTSYLTPEKKKATPPPTIRESPAWSTTYLEKSPGWSMGYLTPEKEKPAPPPTNKPRHPPTTTRPRLLLPRRSPPQTIAGRMLRQMRLRIYAEMVRARQPPFPNRAVRDEWKRRDLDRKNARVARKLGSEQYKAPFYRRYRTAISKTVRYHKLK